MAAQLRIASTVCLLKLTTSFWLPFPLPKMRSDAEGAALRAVRPSKSKSLMEAWLISEQGVIAFTELPGERH